MPGWGRRRKGWFWRDESSGTSEFITVSFSGGRELYEMYESGSSGKGQPLQIIFRMLILSIFG